MPRKSAERKAPAKPRRRKPKPLSSKKKLKQWPLSAVVVTEHPGHSRADGRNGPRHTPKHRAFRPAGKGEVATGYTRRSSGSQRARNRRRGAAAKQARKVNRRG